MDSKIYDEKKLMEYIDNLYTRFQFYAKEIEIWKEKLHDRRGDYYGTYGYYGVASDYDRGMALLESVEMFLNRANDLELKGGKESNRIWVFQVTDGRVSFNELRKTLLSNLDVKNNKSVVRQYCLNALDWFLDNTVKYWSEEGTDIHKRVRKLKKELAIEFDDAYKEVDRNFVKENFLL